MKSLSRLFENNRRWALKMSQKKPSLFTKLAQQQNPKLLWIGCSDSRVPANDIVGLLPGELFVHRNVANLVIHADMNCLSVLQYAVDILNVKHVIVCGHYGCGGIKAVLEKKSHGLVDNWLRSIEHLCHKYDQELVSISTDEERIDYLCELNIVEQVKNVGNTTIVQEAWSRLRDLSIHGWIYSISTGLLYDMGVSISSYKDLAAIEANIV